MGVKVGGVDFEGIGLDDDGCFIESIASNVIKYRAPRLRGHEELMDRLQKIHDYTDFSPLQFRELANSMGLSDKVITDWESKESK